jgi:predicted nucleic acid-binding protein
VALDTAIFIYFIEEHPRFMPLLEPLFEAIEAAHVLAVTSALSLLETLVVPFRAGDRALTLRYESILTQSQGLTLVELTVPVLKRAAELRASAGLKTPDAIQLAAALSAGCTAFLSNDRRISSAQRLRVFQLDDFVSKRIKDQ